MTPRDGVEGAQRADDAASLESVGAVGVDARGVAIIEESKALTFARSRCNPRERRTCELYVQYGNKVKAWREVYAPAGRPKPEYDYRHACDVLNSDHASQYILELEREASRHMVIDYSLVLRHDLELVKAAGHEADLSRRVWECCRDCHGINHKYQWRDENEYLNAYAAAIDAHAAKQAVTSTHLELKTPSDEGGYGFDPHNEPSFDCRSCDGHGVQRTIISDTSRMSRHAKAMYRGIKETKNGIEVLTHDIDKAKERLGRAVGAFGDDASSVARGAAAGAAAGVAAAAALAAKVATMTEEEMRQGYLQLTTG